MYVSDYLARKYTDRVDNVLSEVPFALFWSPVQRKSANVRVAKE